MTQTDENNLDFVFTQEDADVTVYDATGSLSCDLGDTYTTNCTMQMKIKFDPYRVYVSSTKM